MTTTTENLIQIYRETNDLSVRDQIIEDNLSLIHFVLGQLGITRENPDYDDLASQGALGLLDALARFDLARETRFNTYATLRIRGTVLDYLRSQDWLTRNDRDNVNRVKVAHSELYNELKREPTTREMSERVNLPEDKVEQAVLDASKIFISLDSFVMDDNETASYHEMIVDEGAENPMEKMEEVDLLEALSGFIEGLPRREKLVLSLYYYEELTLKEIGQVLDLSESRVSQIHSRIILLLRSQLSQTGIYTQRARSDNYPADRNGRSMSSGWLQAADLYR